MKYQIVGEPLPIAICDLDANEYVITESGAMSYMTDNIKMETVGGSIGGMFGRVLSGENLFQNKFTAIGREGQIGFVSRVPGSIRAYEVTPNKALIVQKGGFLVGTAGINLSVHYKKKLGSSLFGGEGFIMQKISGNGTVLVEIDGFAVDYDLEVGEKVIVDTGYLAVMEESCTMDIQMVSGVKNMFFGGEGLFHTVITGPGKVVLQTMPLSSFAGAIIPFLPTQRS